MVEATEREGESNRQRERQRDRTQHAIVSKYACRNRDLKYLKWHAYGR